MDAAECACAGAGAAQTFAAFEELCARCQRRVRAYAAAQGLGALCRAQPARKAEGELVRRSSPAGAAALAAARRAREQWRRRVAAAARESAALLASRDRESELAEQLTELRLLNAYLQDLRAVCLLNESYYIWVVDEVGYINGARVSLLDADWSGLEEVNTALGDVAALLRHMACVEQVASPVRLLCYGARSMVVDADKKVLPLFLSKRFMLFRLGLPQFNAALKCLLDLFLALAATLAARAGAACPFTVRADYSIKGHGLMVEMQKEVEWAAAMRYFLINLKWAISEFHAHNRCEF